MDAKPEPDKLIEKLLTEIAIEFALKTRPNEGGMRYTSVSVEVLCTKFYEQPVEAKVSWRAYSRISGTIESSNMKQALSTALSKDADAVKNLRLKAQELLKEADAIESSTRKNDQ
jgi:hypothetical protein